LEFLVENRKDLRRRWMRMGSREDVLEGRREVDGRRE